MISSSSKLVSKALLRRHSTIFNASGLSRSTASSASRFLSTRPRNRENGDERNDLIPGSKFQQSSYGSLGDPASINNNISVNVNRIEPNTNSTRACWQAQNDADVQHVTEQALIYELTRTTADTIEKVVPWFLNTMPESYFRQIPPYLRREHVKALAAIIDADMDLYLNLKSKTSDGRTVYTFIRPTTQAGTLLGMVEELPECNPSTPSLTRLHVFSAADDSFSLNMFVMGESKSQLDGEPVSAPNPTSQRPYCDTILNFASDVRDGKYISEYPDLDPTEAFFEESSLDLYLSKCRDNYLKVISDHPERFLRQRLLFESVSETEGCEARVEEAVHESVVNSSSADGKEYWLDVAMANSLPQVALERTSRLLYVQGFDVVKARLDVIPDGDSGSVTMLRLLVHPVKDDTEPAINDVGTTNSKFERLKYNLKRSKWLDETTMKLVFEDQRWLGVRRGEIITAMCNLLHPIFNKSAGSEGSSFYSKHNILVCIIHRNLTTLVYRFCLIF